MLRDAFLLRHGGDDPGPAGRMLVAWRGLDRSAPLAGDAAFHVAETLQLKAALPPVGIEIRRAQL